MPFLKHQYVFYTPDELRAAGLYHHTEACSLTEVQTYQPQRGRPVPPPKTYHYCIRHQGCFAFPKGYAADHMGWGRSAPDLRVTDGMRWNPDVRFAGALKSKLRQDVAVEAAYNALEKTPHRGCTLSLPCGYGKTVCGLALASILRRKTFVLVHTLFLARQWEDRIKQFIPGARVRQIKSMANFDEDKGCEFGIGLMQTVKNMSSSLFSNYGFLIIDEAHHLPCQTLQDCLPKFNSRYTLALSATPTRIDGLADYIFWSVGRIAYQITPAYPNVQVLKADYHKRDGFNAGDHLLNFDTRISTDPDRDERIARIIERCLVDTRRRVLVLTLRRQHAKNLADAIASRAPPAAKVHLMLGGDKAATSAPPDDTRVIVATYQLVQEGFDCPGLNTLVLAMPRGDLVQSIGRITRVGGEDDHESDTVKPWVIDIVDQCAEGRRKSKSRRAHYARLKMPSQFAQW